MHANAPVDVVARFEALGALAGLAPDAVRAQLAAAIDLVVHVSRVRGHRRIASVAALFRRDASPTVVPALEWDGPGHLPRTGPGWPALAARLGLSPGLAGRPPLGAAPVGPASVGDGTPEAGAAPLTGAAEVSPAGPKMLDAEAVSPETPAADAGADAFPGESSRTEQPFRDAS